MSKKLLIIFFILTMSSSCYEPKREGDYAAKQPISTETGEGIELIITEERFSEPPVSMEMKDGMPKPVQDWMSHDMMEYRVGAGDTIRVIILVNLEANSYEVMVATDGTVVLPLIGPFPIGGKTVEFARDDIRNSLSQYYINPQIQLRVITFASQIIYVMGPEKNSIYNVTKRTTLFEVINSLDVPFSTIDLETAYLTRDGKMYPLHLEKLVKGDLSQNYELQSNDILYLPNIKDQMIFILGEVNRPGEYKMNRKENLFTLLAQAGGPKLGAQLREIRIIRGGLENPILLTVNINPLMKRRPSPQMNSEDLTTLSISVEAARKNTISLEKLYLRDGDIVFVPPTALEKWNQIINQISPTFNFGFTRPITMARDVLFIDNVLSPTP